MFKLKRIDKVPSDQLLAGPAGSAFHTMTEVYDLGGDVQSYEYYLQKELEDDVPYVVIRSESYEWWVEHAETMFRDYIAWRRLTGWELVSAEEKFSVQPEGLSVPFIGYIDRRFRLSTGHVAVVDIKTGMRTPNTSIQLCEYSAASRILGHQADAATFYHARIGRATGLEWPIDWDEMKLVQHVSPVEQAILADEFPPKASATNCRYCSVKEHCDYRWGKKK